jgi:ketosteroid isomerase-like protein
MIKHALLVMTFLFVSVVVIGQTGEEKEVAASIESLKKAILSVDAVALNQLTAEKLSYGHSSGLVEDKKEFIRKITSKENVYTNIIITNQGITISGDVAIVRNLQEIFTNDDGKPAELKLIVMMVWQKQDKQWKLLGRQSVRKPEPK